MGKYIRGLINENPLNVKQVPEIWDGSIPPYQDKDGHAVFCDPLYSVRAAVRTLSNYARDGRDTLQKIFEEYAPVDDPAAKNDPNNYANFVAGRITWAVDQPLGIFDANGVIDKIAEGRLIRLIDAMMEQEIYAGYGVPLETITSGIALYRRDYA